MHDDRNRFHMKLGAGLTIVHIRLCMAILAGFGAMTTAAAQPATVVRALLDDAAVRFDIPSPLLYAIAYNESRWHHVQPDSLSPSCTGMPPAIGIMGLHDDSYFGRSLRTGIALGITPEEAATNIQKNIIVGAAYLAGLFTGTNRENLEEWLPAIGAYSGIPEQQRALRLLYTDGVLELIRQGWVADDQYIVATQAPVINRAYLAEELEAMGLAVVAKDFPGAEWHPSPNFSGRGGTPISAITIHDTEGNFAGALSWLTSVQSEASAHYMIRSVDGFTVQMVREADKAWHVRDENPYTIGIEHEGYTSRPEYFTPAMYGASATLARYLIDAYHIPLDRAHVKGHLDFPNNSHTDPGGWWDWPGYFRRISGKQTARVVIDPFEDNVVGWWQPGLSGSTTGVDTALTRLRITSGAAYNGTRGAEISYAFTNAAGGIVRIFRSGHGNTNDGLLNVGSTGSVTLAIRGDASGHELEFWLYDAEKGNRIVRAGVLGWSGWRTVSVPLASLGSGGPFRFHSIVIRQTAGKGRSGTIAADELAHEVGIAELQEAAGEPQAPARAVALRADDPFPEALRHAEDITIYSALGDAIHRFGHLPATTVGTLLRPGVYGIVSSAGRSMILVRE